MEIAREKIPGRIEEVVVRQTGAWTEVHILGWDGQPRTVWKYPDVDTAKAKATEVKGWLEQGKLW